MQHGHTVKAYPAHGFCQDRIYFTHFRKKTGDQPKLYIWAGLPRNVMDPEVEWNVLMHHIVSGPRRIPMIFYGRLESFGQSTGWRISATNSSLDDGSIACFGRQERCMWKVSLVDSDVVWLICLPSQKLYAFMCLWLNNFFCFDVNQGFQVIQSYHPFQIRIYLL